VHILVHNLPKNCVVWLLHDSVKGRSLRLGSNVAVAFQHPLGNVSSDSQDRHIASPSSSLKRRSGDFGANFFGEVIHSHYVQIEKAM